MQRLVLVEDDRPLRSELAVLLRRNGYDVFEIESFDNIAAAILEAAPDLVLLDLNLPGVDGHYVCREVRAASDVPIVVVTSRNTDMDEVLSMSLGADDFVAKPFNAQVLLAHIAAVLKRSYGDAANDVVSHRGLVLDMARCTVSYQGQSAELTKNEQRILAMLMRSAGQVVERRSIQEELWASDEFVDDNTLTVNVSHLRRTLAGIGADGFVQTKRGMGYMVQ